MSATGVHGVSEPAFCVVAQGSKTVFVGDERYLYDPAHYLLFTAELPYASQAIEASPACPYLSLRLNLDPTLVSSVMVKRATPAAGRPMRATNVSLLDASLLDAVVRLVRLVDTPADAPILLPLITRNCLSPAHGQPGRPPALYDGATRPYTSHCPRHPALPPGV
ncbi:MAG: AraC family transcriptional regulator [Caldilineaceae bacterium]